MCIRDSPFKQRIIRFGAQALRWLWNSPRGAPGLQCWERRKHRSAPKEAYERWRLYVYGGYNRRLWSWKRLAFVRKRRHRRLYGGKALKGTDESKNISGYIRFTYNKGFGVVKHHIVKNERWLYDANVDLKKEKRKKEKEEEAEKRRNNCDNYGCIKDCVCFGDCRQGVFCL